jgi:hypothetical protein
MATVTKTIGTSSRDYSTINAWEADLNSDSIYSDGDTAVGEMHADSTFTGATSTIENGSAIGGSSGYDLALIKLTVHEDSRHDGTAESGALLKPTADSGHNQGIIRINVDNVTVEWLDISLDSLDSKNTNKAITLTGTNDDCILRNMLIHDKGGNPGGTGPFMIHLLGAGASSDTLSIQNNIIYNIVEGSNDNAAAMLLNEWSGTVNVYNNTIYNIQSQGGSKIAFGIRSAHVSGSTSNIKNNIVAKLVGGNGERAFEDGIANGSAGTFNEAYNLSDDTSTAAYDARGTGSLANKTIAEIAFISTVSTSEDLRLAQLSSSAVPSVCRDAGVDLGTTNGVNIDIAGRDRDAAGDTWDIGAHEQVYISTPFIGFVE